MIVFMKKKLLILPILWLVLGAVAIATEIKTSDLSPAGQQLSGTVVRCIKVAVDKKESAFIVAVTTYQNGYIAALTTKKVAVLAAWDKTSKKEIKLALTQASKAYKTTMNTLKKTLKTSEKAIQTTYKTDIKACKWVGIQDLADMHTEED